MNSHGSESENTHEERDGVERDDKTAEKRADWEWKEHDIDINGKNDNQGQICDRQVHNEDIINVSSGFLGKNYHDNQHVSKQPQNNSDQIESQLDVPFQVYIRREIFCGVIHLLFASWRFQGKDDLWANTSLV